MSASGTSTRTVADVMSHGIVTCDGDMSARAVAQTLRDRKVPAVFVVDLGSEAVGVVEERSLLGAWDEPDKTTAATLMELDPLVIDPGENLATAIQRMLDAGTTHAVVAPPAPTEESGRWSAWKERGMPLGTLSLADILWRIEDVQAAARSRPTSAGQSAARRAAPWIALLSVLLVLAFVALVVFLYASGTHHRTNRPGLQ